MLAIPLLFALVSCRHANQDRNAIWIGNADIQSAHDAVNDFASAFALDPSCHGLSLSLSLNSEPSGPYWFLETYYSNDLHPELVPEQGKRFEWWMQHDYKHAQTTAEGHTGGDNKSAADGVHQVCFIVNHNGGLVR